MEDFPELYTKRLHLRKIQFEDLTALVKHANNKKIADRIINIPHPYREPDAAFRISFVVKGFKSKTRYVFAIILESNQEMIGEISLHFLDKDQRHAQLAYWIGEPFWNKGIATEASKAVIQFGLEDLNLDLIYADCDTDNIASQKVLINSGMTEQPQNGKLRLFKITKR